MKTAILNVSWLVIKFDYLTQQFKKEEKTTFCYFPLFYAGMLISKERPIK